MYKEPTDIMGFILISLFVEFCLFIVFLFFRPNDEKSGVFGSLLLNGHFICHTLENKAKIIHTGLYFIENSKSPKFKKELPLIYSAEVPAKRGIRVHCGNDAAKDSLGCILVGMKRNESK